MNAYTPGPWFPIVTPAYLSAGHADTISIGSDAHTEEIATVWSYLLPTRANAQLIAAAPTMATYIAKRASLGDTEATQILKEIGLASQENTTDGIG